MPAFPISKNVSGPVRPLPKSYSLRACGTCVKAKAKCVAAGPKCMRCQRLHKECLPPATLPRRPVKARTTQLEKRLDSLVDLLAKQGMPVDESEEQQHISPYGSPDEEPTPNQASKIERWLECNESMPLLGSNNGKNLRQSCFPRDSGTFSDPFAIDSKETDDLLLEYRNFMSSQFPFVVLQPHETSESLRSKKPFLWKAIMTTASHPNLDRQIAMGKKFTEEFTTELLLHAKKSLDMLQGLLVHIAWYHYHSLINPQLTNFLYLSKSLVCNLGLDKTPVTKDTRKILLENLEAFQVDDAGPSETDSCLLQEWRALLGCFYLGSTFTRSCRRMEPPQLTPFIIECSEALGVIKEYESDGLLMQLFRLQRIALKIPRSLDDDAIPFAQFQSNMQANLLQEQLKSFMNSLPQTLQQNTVILLDFQLVQTSLYEPALYQRSSNQINIDHLNSLSTCLANTKSLLTVYSQTLSLSRNSTLLYWIHYGYIVLMAYKLSLLQIEGWNPLLTRQELGFDDILKTHISKLESLMRLASNRPQDEIFARFAKQLERIRLQLFNKEDEISGSMPSLAAPISSGDFDFEMDFHEMEDSFWQGMNTL